MQLVQTEMALLQCVYFSSFFAWPSFFYPYQEAAWPSGQRVRLEIQQPRVRVLPWPLAGFVLGLP